MRHNRHVDNREYRHRPRQGRPNCCQPPSEYVQRSTFAIPRTQCFCLLGKGNEVLKVSATAIWKIKVKARVKVGI